MKSILSLLSFSLLCVITWAQVPQLSAYLDHAVFNTTFDEPYVETYIGVDTRTLTLAEVEGGLQGGVLVTLLVKDGEEIVNFDKYELKTQVITDSSMIRSSLMAQRRLSLDEGVYGMELSIEDLNNPENTATLPIIPVIIDFADNSINLSDLHLIEEAVPVDEPTPFSRSGLDMVPYLLPYFPTAREDLWFYAEVYGLDQEYLDEDILVRYFVSAKGAKQPISDMLAFQKQKGRAVNAIVGKLPIKNLPSGEYELQLEIRDRQNELLIDRRKAIFRSNRKSLEDFNNLALLDIENTFVAAYTDTQINYYLDASAVIATPKEQQVIKTLQEQSDPMLRRQFLYNFWLDRDLVNPEERWKKYLTLVRFTEETYATMNRHGFDTDRGRVYLQYGPPNEMDRSGFEAASNPHELWVYNTTPRGETNVIFVFMNSDMVSNDFRLIHSTATGEIFNENWQAQLFNTFTPSSIDGADSRDHFGTKVTDQYQYLQQRDR